jgi:hypothetical protein
MAGSANYMNDPLVEIVRSYSRKVNLRKYESEDHFCSAKTMCNWSEAQQMSEQLYSFCRREVLNCIEGLQPEPVEAPSPEPAPLIPESLFDQSNSLTEQPKDKYGIAAQVIAEIDSLKKECEEAITPEPEGPQKTAKEQCEDLTADIMRVVPCTQKHRHEFFLGWFGKADGRGLPRNTDAFLEPLKALVAAVRREGPAGEMLLNNPRQLGESLRIILRQNDKALPPDVIAETKPEITDADVFDDPLMHRFGWKDMQTVATADAWMTAYNKTVDEYADYAKFLKMDKLPEEELRWLLVFLYHDTTVGFDLWKKCQERGVLLCDAAHLVSAAGNFDFGLGVPKKGAVIAMSSVFASL